jgi:hypothetical protein
MKTLYFILFITVFIRYKSGKDVDDDILTYSGCWTTELAISLTPLIINLFS